MPIFLPLALGGFAGLEPRERLRRLGHLMSALAEALRQPALEPSGALAPLPGPLAE